MATFKRNQRQIQNVCDPFKKMSDTALKRSGCSIPYELSIAEKPYIKNVRGPLTDHPFVDVERLRTPIDKLSFTISEYERLGDGFVGTSKFDSINYQNYVPSGIFKKRFYYTVMCIAVNKSGHSPESNKYPVNLLDFPEEIKDTQKIICGGTIICDIPILCG